MSMAEFGSVALGTQFPDLVDKPLGWATTLLPGGISMGHSLLFALPFCLAILVVSRGIDRLSAGIAVAVGYLLHLPGDALYPMLVGGDPRLAFLFWPLFGGGGGSTVAVVPYVSHLFTQFLGFLGTPRGLAYLGLEVVLLGLTLWRWHSDGSPGLSWLRKTLAGVTSGGSRR